MSPTPPPTALAAALACWKPLRYVPEQARFWRCLSSTRFNVGTAGRRSGKTCLAKRHLALSAMQPVRPHAMYFAAGPTRPFAKAVFWDDLKAMLGPAIRGKPNETELEIKLKVGSTICVRSLDEPSRIEGVPWSGGLVTECADINRDAWWQHVRPSLDTEFNDGGPPGWCCLEGTPSGCTWYHADLVLKIQSGELPAATWAHHTWLSSAVLSPEAIMEAKRSLPPELYEQEYEGKFISFAGRAIYNFDAALNCQPLVYDPKAPLLLGFDWNVDPGTAVVMQEYPFGTGVVDEVWIPRNSNTEAVCHVLMERYGTHAGPVELYGDATGGARHTSQTMGSDIDIARRELKFTGGVAIKFPAANPSERARVNALNARCLNGLGERQFYVDGAKCPQVVLDLSNVGVVEGGSGQIDKKADVRRGHLLDCVSYVVEARHPIAGLPTAKFSAEGYVITGAGAFAR